MVPISLFVPPFDGASPQWIKLRTADMLTPIDVLHDKQYLISLTKGHLFQPAALMALLKGEYHKDRSPSDSGS